MQPTASPHFSRHSICSAMHQRSPLPNSGRQCMQTPAYHPASPFAPEDSLSTIRFSSRLNLSTPANDRSNLPSVFNPVGAVHSFSLPCSPVNSFKSSRRRVDFSEEPVFDETSDVEFDVPHLQDTDSSCYSTTDHSPIVPKPRLRPSRSLGGSPIGARGRLFHFPKEETNWDDESDENDVMEDSFQPRESIFSLQSQLKFDEAFGQGAMDTGDRDSEDDELELEIHDFLFDTTTVQIKYLQNKSNRLSSVIHRTGTLDVEASRWMVWDPTETRDVPQIIPVRCQSTPLVPRVFPCRQGSMAQNSFRGDSEQNFSLPVSRMTDDGCRCISPDTMSDLLLGRYDNIDHFVVIDCRFTFEYVAGHVNGAIHVQDRDLLEALYAANKALSQDGKVVCWIFYCEFSQQRAPETATWFRKHDRTEHLADYPNLSFPNVYIMEGGFSKFWSTFSDSPMADIFFHRNAYLSMWDDAYEASRKTHTLLRQSLWGGGKGARKNKLQQKIAARSDPSLVWK